MTLTYRRDFLKLGAVAAAGTLFQSASHGAWADSLNASTRDDLLLPGGGKGPCSGLPWFSGAFGNPDLFAKWRGKPLDVYATFVTNASWATMLAFPSNASFPNYAKKPVWLSLAYPWLPKKEGFSEFTSFWDEVAELDPARQTRAASLFWSRHLQIMNNIAKCLNTKKADGITPLYPYLGLVVRVNWEFNGNGSNVCKLTDFTKAPQYCKIFNRFVTLFRELLPNIVIEWNVLRKGQDNAYFSQIYPGDGCVDIISVCHYDRMPSMDTQQIWDEQTVQRNTKTKTTCTTQIIGGKKVKTCSTTTLWDKPWGLVTWAEFADQHDKMFAVPEWGLSNGWTSTNNCVDRDNPLFIENMMRFFDEHADILAYESYFNSASRHMLYPPGQVPYNAALEVDAAGNDCVIPSLNWPNHVTSVNDRAAKRYCDLIQYYYDKANT